MTKLAIVVFLCGAGTFLLRFLPIWQNRRHPRAASTSGRIRAFLQGIGPAAITALLVVSFWPMVTSHGSPLHGLLIICALTSIVLIKRRFGGIAGPTLAGALIYGALVHMIS